MPRPDPRAPGAGQESMFEAMPVTPPIRRGRHSEAVDGAISAAQSAGYSTDVDEAANAVLRAGAWALDQFEATAKPYGPAKIMPAMTEVLRELQMTPAARAVETPTSETDDAIAALVREFRTIDDDTAAAPVRDRP